jgi:hypothetical protein
MGLSKGSCVTMITSLEDMYDMAATAFALAWRGSC